MRRNAAEQEPKKVESTEINEAYLGDVSARMFELQAERARLEGEGASAAELKKIDEEIAPLQAFIDEHAEDYARMEMPRETTQTVRVPERLREQPSDLKTQLKDLQKQYDLTAEQLETETDPEARAALANGIDSLRQRVHALKGDVPWEKEDRLLAKGTLKRSSAARIKGREAARESFEAAETDRAVLVDLRNTYSQALESGALPKAGESLIRGAVQTVEDALDRYGRGDMSADAFQSRVKDISKARKMWDRYVSDETAGAERAAAKQRELIERTRKAVKEKANIEAAETAAAEFRARLEERRRAKQEMAAIIAAGLAESEARSKAGEKAKSAAEFRTWLDEQKVKLGKAPTETAAALEELRNLPPPPTAEETARRQANELVGAMEAGPDTNVPENLPVEPVAETDEEFRARFRAEATAKAAEIGRGSVERVNARIDELQAKVRAEQDRLRRERNELKPGEEEAWFAQGEKPEELARRERAQELYPDMDVNRAAAEIGNIEAKSARDFSNKTDFMEAFSLAAVRDPKRSFEERADMDKFSAMYWELLMKDNARLAEAMKPQPKVGFFRRLFGGGPRPKETMTSQEVIQFQKMDKMVRDIMETPATGDRASIFRAGAGKSSSSSYIGIGRSKPPR